MRQRHVDDPWAQQLLNRAEELLAEARAFMAQQATGLECRRPLRAARVWLGSVLITLGRRLLQPVSKPTAPA
jgi:hypothetical protein